MIRFRITKGLIFIEGNKKYQLQRKVFSGKYQLEDENGELVNFTFEEMLTKWRTMKWVIDIRSIGASAEVFFMSTPADFNALSPKNQKIVIC